MNTSDLITLIRTKIEQTGFKCFSPDLPQNNDMCCAVYLGTGTNTRAINKKIVYSEIPLYVIIRGSSNDKETRQMVDSIYNQLDMIHNQQLNNTQVILISCLTPNYSYRDENQRIHYSITCNCKIEWSEE